MPTVNVNITSSTPDQDPVTVSIGDTLQFTSKDSRYRVSALANVLGATTPTLDIPPNGSNSGVVPWNASHGRNEYHINRTDTEPRAGSNPSIIVRG